MNIGDIFNEIKKGITTVGQFFGVAVKLGNAIKTAWTKCGPQTLTVASQVFYDVMKAASQAEQAAQAGAGGSWMGAVTLSEQTISSIKQLITDLHAGEAQVVADFKELQYDFTHPSA